MWSHRYVGVIKEVNGNKARIVQHTNAKTVVIDLQARLVGMQLATCNLQHVQYRMRHVQLPRWRVCA